LIEIIADCLVKYDQSIWNANCPYCNHSNIVGDETDVCEHFEQQEFNENNDLVFNFSLNPKIRKEIEIDKVLKISYAELFEAVSNSKDYAVGYLECPYCHELTMPLSLRENCSMRLHCGCKIPYTFKSKISTMFETLRICKCGMKLNFDDYYERNSESKLESKVDLLWLWNAKHIEFKGKKIPIEIECCSCFKSRNSPEVILIQCPKCDHWLEMDIDQPRTESNGNGFTWIKNTDSHAIYRCDECNTVVESKTYNPNERGNSE